MGDLLTVLVILPLLALIARAWLSRLPDDHREIVAFGASFLITAVLAKVLLERVWFHQTDGALAHFAHRSDEWFSFILPLLVAGLLVGFTGMIVMGILHPLAGALGICSGLAIGLAIPFVLEWARQRLQRFTPKSGFVLLRHKHAPMIGAAGSAAIGTVCAFLPQENYLDAIVAGGYGLAIMLLTGPVDASAVRYMTVVGHSSASLLRHWLPIQLALLLPFAAVLLIAQSWTCAAVATLVALGLPAITTMRIFAYRSFSRVIADWVTSFLILAAAYLAFTFPPLGPIPIVASIAWLAWRGKDLTWLAP